MAGSDSSSTPNSNKNFVARDGRSSTFDRSMTSFLKARSPYAYDILDTEENKNTKYKYFKSPNFLNRPHSTPCKVPCTFNDLSLANVYISMRFELIKIL